MTAGKSFASLSWVKHSRSTAPAFSHAMHTKWLPLHRVRDVHKLPVNGAFQQCSSKHTTVHKLTALLPHHLHRRSTGSSTDSLSEACCRYGQQRHRESSVGHNVLVSCMLRAVPPVLELGSHLGCQERGQPVKHHAAEANGDDSAPTTQHRTVLIQNGRDTTIDIILGLLSSGALRLCLADASNATCLGDTAHQLWKAAVPARGYIRVCGLCLLCYTITLACLHACLQLCHATRP